MFYLSDHLLDSLLLSDIEHGDLTTRALHIGEQAGVMTFARKTAGRVSGVAVAEKLLHKLSLESIVHVKDGHDVPAGTILLTINGSATQLHQGWKVVQNVLEWCCGVANYMAEMTTIAQQINPAIRIACTRKSIPCTKPLAIMAIAHGGGILHRAGTAESILLFANHRHFWSDKNDWQGMVAALRLNAPEKKIIVEADDVAEARAVLLAQPDILQLDKFTPEQIQMLLDEANIIAPNCLLSIAGGVNKNNIDQFAATGIKLIVTSSPYYAMPDDIKVIIKLAE